ncbi:MAG TPA: ABC transporter substrate-binding protein [Candidatus Acidoferrum sp.]|jgi:branched-chain amino acid transport system substrate-binding protein|nr:ABC transporter substrate-binding protein [Candidatus Acidoferrum sp.]
MKLRVFALGLLALVVAAVAAPMPAAAQNEMFIPMLVYRTGAYAPSGTPFANGFHDYIAMINARDGGVNGVKLVTEECETQYDTKQGVECYERLKGKGSTVMNPLSTGITYQLIPKAAVDKIVVHSMGYGMTAASDGRWFPWVFTFPTTYWSQASAVIKYIAQQEGGLDKLKGKKIVHIFHNSPYGKEANPTLEELARKYQFELTLLAVDHPGQEQKSTWLQVRRINPEWIFMSGWGVMNQVAVKEAASIGFKMDHFIGNWWSASDADVIPAGDGAKGYKGATFHAPGTNFKAFQDLSKFVVDKGQSQERKDKMGEPLYNRGVVNAMFLVEAIRTAQAKFGKKAMSGEEMRWGYEHLNVTDKRLEELGLKGFTHPVKVSCEDHEGSGPVLVQQWDGKKWNIVSDWIEPMRDVVRPKLEAAAAEEGKKLGYTQRDCAKEK